MYQIKMTQKYGRGLYATKTIKKGTVIAICELLVLSALDTMLIEHTELKYYTFKYNELQDCLVLGDGEIFNHSDKQNVNYFLKSKGKRKLMHFVAIRDIKKGEQLFIDYNFDTQVNPEKYIKNASLI